MDDKFQQPDFGGYEREELPTITRLEEVIGSYVRTSGTPTWTPATTAQAVAIDPDAGAIYFYEKTSATWVALTAPPTPEPNVPRVIASGAYMAQDEKQVHTIYVNSTGDAQLLRLNFTLRVSDPHGTGGTLLWGDVEWTDDLGAPRTFRTEVLDFNNPDLEMTNWSEITGTTPDSITPAFVTLGDGETLLLESKSNIGGTSLSAGAYDFYFTVELIGDPLF